MGQPRQSLKLLRQIALAHCRHGHPDLALLARELGSAVRAHAAHLAVPAARLGSSRQPRVRRLRTGMSDLELLLVAWPANHRSVLHDHGARWGLEVPLHGAMQIESWTRRSDGAAPLAHGWHWLGPGDALWFDADQARLHRCRNLSCREPALCLHLFGGAAAHGMAYALDLPASGVHPRASTPALAGAMPG